ncbi:hypothetical protein FACS1894186_2260 [Alphaproteobacteria bacterium]|nr:hypothetical protein FACS1894186_2260 [Alphaproteobacteria bacterium]
MIWPKGGLAIPFTILTLAVGLVFGAAAYFAPSAPPPLPAAALATAAVSGLALLPRTRSAGLAAMAFALGFWLAAAGAAKVAAPVLAAPVEKTWVEGEISAVRALPGGWHITLAPSYIKRQAKPYPRRLALSLSGRHHAEPRAGQKVGLFASLAPPLAPAIPNRYDPRLFSWFDGVGGRGRALSRLKVKGENPAGLAQSVRARLRGSMTGAIADPDAAAVALALVLGEQSSIRAGLLRAWRDSGISHMLSVSGLHMALLAGTLFWLLRSALSLAPRLEGLDAKRPAAAVSLVALTAYLFVSGGGIPATRSYIMAAVAMVALLLGRRPISLRALAFAAVIVVLWRPEAPLTAGFQLSFAAVMAMAALFERFSFASLGRWRGAAAAFVAVDLAATAATLPFVLYHFGRANPWSLAANALASPVLGLWVMPWLLAGCLLAPLGAEFPWRLAGLGIEALNRIAAWVGGWPHAALTVPALPTAGFLLAVAGLIGICLAGRGKVRLACAAAYVAGTLSFMAARPPDAYLAPELQAARMADGALAFSDPRKGRRLRRAWLAHNGQAPTEKSAFPFDANMLAAMPGTQKPAMVWLAPLHIETDDCTRRWCPRYRE